MVNFNSTSWSVVVLLLLILITTITLIVSIIANLNSIFIRLDFRPRILEKGDNLRSFTLSEYKVGTVGHQLFP